MTEDMIITVANPGASADAMLYDESGNGQDTPNRSERRIIVNVYANQIVTVFHELQLVAGGTWRAANGAGDATTSNTLFDKDYVLKAGKNRIRIAVTTAPTTWEVKGRLCTERAAAV